MTAHAKPYSPQTLAERWGCSDQKIRNMIEDRELAGFRLGKLIRIPASEVERYECQSLTPSPATEENSPSPIETMAESRAEFRLARTIGDGPKLSPVNYGNG